MTQKKRIILGQWTRKSLDALLKETAGISHPGRRVSQLSKQFLGLPYKGSTLIGGPSTSEVFVINLAGIDCMTFLEYVEAMRLASSYREFVARLKQIRYMQDRIHFDARNHFFTDWREMKKPTVIDITEKIGGGKTVTAKKDLVLRTMKTGKTEMKSRKRTIAYIPANALDRRISAHLKTGDYIGIYARDKDLDVSHVGLVLKSRGRMLLRHASSANAHKRVVDEDFTRYIMKTPGIIVFRPINPSCL